MDQLIVAQLVSYSRIVWNTKVHYPVHKSPQLNRVLNQANPVHSLQAYFSKIDFTIILPAVTCSLSLSHIQMFPFSNNLNLRFSLHVRENWGNIV